MSKIEPLTPLEREVFRRGSQETYKELSESLRIPSIVLRDIYDSAFDKYAAWKKEKNKRTINYWDQSEVNLLVKADREDLSNEEVAALFPGRSKKEVIEKLRVFRKTRTYPLVRSYWTPEEDERLIREYENGEPLRNIAGYLHKSKQAVATRLTKLRKKGELICRKNV